MNEKATYYVIGLMSGTSLDWVDAALVKITEENNETNVGLLHYISEAYTKETKEILETLCVAETASLATISQMNMFLGERYAEITLQLIAQSGLSKQDILLISSHGQTIFHQPNPVVIDGKEIVSTMQIGDIGVIAERVGLPVVGDFRTRDIAAGGQGAPLVPYGDYVCFKEKAFGRVLVNIGGIANITVIPKNACESDVLAYDTGPGNMLIDRFTDWMTKGKQMYDKDGVLASQGRINQQWLKELLTNPYFSLPSPKSTGREMFGIDYAKKAWKSAREFDMTDFDKLATITELTAVTIAEQIIQHMQSSDIKEVLVSGGGRYNHTLMKRIRVHVPTSIGVDGTEKYDMDADAKEAIIFALLGYKCYQKQTNNIPSATGAHKSVVMGKIAW